MCLGSDGEKNEISLEVAETHVRFGHALWKDVREIKTEEGLIQASEPEA